MRIGQIRPLDVANGEGIRVSIFVTGCSHNCPGCFNEEYQDGEFGDLWTDEHLEEVITYLKRPEVDGLTLLGGEPMENLKLTSILKEIKKEVKKTIWIYSGYTYEQIMDDPKKKALLDECDVLVDGPFVEALLNFKLAFRGSSNQRIIDIKASKPDQIVLYME